MSKLATGKLELEIKEEVKGPQNQDQKQEKELSYSCRIHTMWAPESVRVSAHL